MRSSYIRDLLNSCADDAEIRIFTTDQEIHILENLVVTVEHPSGRQIDPATEQIRPNVTTLVRLAAGARVDRQLPTGIWTQAFGFTPPTLPTTTPRVTAG